MKWLIVPAYQVALVFRRGALVEVLTEGRHWVLWGAKLIKYDLTKPFYATMDLDILLKNEQLKSMLTVIQIKDNEIALQYKNGNFHSVLTPGRYAFWKDVIDYAYQVIDLNEVTVAKNIDRKVLHNPAVMPLVRVHAIQSFERGILYVDGQFEKILAPSVYYYWNGERSVQVAKADLRKQALEVNGQELLTKDKAAIRINFLAQYQLVAIEKAMVDTKDLVKQIYSLLQLGLREYIGQLTLDELLAKKSAAGTYVLDFANQKATEMGVELLSAGIRDIILPGDMKEIMNQVLIAEKRAQANVIMRREETASTRSLLNTAKLMEDNEMLYKLKEMEYVEKIADNINTISLNGGGQLVDQLRSLFGVKVD